MSYLKEQLKPTSKEIQPLMGKEQAQRKGNTMQTSPSITHITKKSAILARLGACVD